MRKCLRMTMRRRSTLTTITKLNRRYTCLMWIELRGLIGCGKTTFVENAGRLGFEMSFESVAHNPYLPQFYAGDNSVVYPMEVWLALEREREACKMATKEGDRICDRTPEEDLCFAQLLLDEGRLTPEEHRSYLDVFHRLFDGKSTPDVIIHLDVTPETSLERIRARGRESEQQLSDEEWLGYLTRLKAAYDEQVLGDNVLVVPWDEIGDVTEVLERAREMHTRL